MNIWIVIDGEKKGPFADYEVRRRINAGEFMESTLGWHEGCGEWMPLSRMSLFEREFQQAEPPPLPVDISLAVSVDGWAPGVFWMRRFWARWLDLHLFAGLFWLGLYVAGADVGAVFRNVWLMLLLYLPWIPLEAWFLSRFRTTPGKWLAGLRVVRSDGGNVVYGTALQRAIRVYFLGIGMGWGVLSLICQSIALFAVRAVGRAVWDREGTHVLEGKPWKKRRGLALAVVYFLATQLQWIVVAPYFMEDFSKRYPEWKEWMEKNPPMHLPRRH